MAILRKKWYWFLFLPLYIFRMPSPSLSNTILQSSAHDRSKCETKMYKELTDPAAGRTAKSAMELWAIAKLEESTVAGYSRRTLTTSREPRRHMTRVIYRALEREGNPDKSNTQKPYIRQLHLYLGFNRRATSLLYYVSRAVYFSEPSLTCIWREGCCIYRAGSFHTSFDFKLLFARGKHLFSIQRYGN